MIRQGAVGQPRLSIRCIDSSGGNKRVHTLPKRRSEGFWRLDSALFADGKIFSRQQVEIPAVDLPAKPALLSLNRSLPVPVYSSQSVMGFSR